MELAHQWITDKAKVDSFGLVRQSYVYMLRPNPYYKKLLQQQISAIVPPDMNPSETIGIAIRGSDKCKSESMCLSFDRYMELATDVAYPALSSSSSRISISPTTSINLDSTLQQKRPKLIMTTEDPQIFNESLVYQRNSSFPFQFLVNDDDNMQGSGAPRQFSSGEAEKTIVSSLTALQVHFNAGRVYLNCCSNFHLVLKYLFQSQCGATRHGHDFVFDSIEDTAETYNSSTGAIISSDHHRSRLPPPPVAQCLSDSDIPRRYRICCSWTRGKVCKDIWKEYREEKEANKNGTKL